MKLLVIMDPVEAIHIKKDSTLAILLAAQQRNWELFYIQPKDLFFANNKVQALCQPISVQNTTPCINFLTSPKAYPLTFFDIIFMRKDPPFDRAFLYATHLLSLAKNEGCYIVNDPQSIRDANEKLFPLWFPKIYPPLLVSSNIKLLINFLHIHKKIVVKPLYGMAGESIFVLNENDININVTLEMLTRHETMLIMAQLFIPEITKGDKRILMINGIAYPHAISRIPANDDFRGNLAKGANGVGATLSKNDEKLCRLIGPHLKERGLFFVGLDVIGNYITEINVTSPTGIREIEAAFSVNICDIILDNLIENRYRKT